MSKKWIAILLFMFVAATSVKAQSADDVLRYSLEYPSYDPVSLVMPSVSQATGFGAYQANPATMALFDESYFSFSLSSRFINESAGYLGNTSEFSDNQTNIGDIGFVYKIPTVQGSLVIGGGYSQTNDFNRAFSVSGFNQRSSLTDYFTVTPDDSLFFAAFDAFAIDTLDNSFASAVSIFRFATPFMGINQDVELIESGRMGEYSAFFATELLKNFSVGASIGYLSGTYSYKREFLESDRQNYYNIQPLNDIDNIFSLSTIEAELEAFSARFGIVYEPSDHLNIGVSYEFPARLRVNEVYNTEITTTFDNGDQVTYDAPGALTYSIVRPQRLKAGFTLESSNGLIFSASAEAVPYSEGRIEFEELEFNPLENEINGVVESNLKDVINLRGGLAFEVNDRFTPRVGYAYFPAPQKEIGTARQFISGGFSTELTEGLIFDFGLQYSFWEDQNVLYSTPNVIEIVEEDVSRIHAMFGIKMAL